jgi:hypothetical protein
MIKNHLRYALSTAFFLASGIGNLAMAVDEIDVPPNDTLATAQRLTVDSSRILQVQGIIGVVSTATPVKADVDFYSFRGRAGDVVRIDIDHGIKTGGSSRSLDSLIAIFHPDGSIIDQKRARSQGSILGSTTFACRSRAYIRSALPAMDAIRIERCACSCPMAVPRPSSPARCRTARTP